MPLLFSAPKYTPYHPSSNGQAERAVQVLKEALKKSSIDPLATQLSRFLFKYRITPHTTTGLSPAEMLMGRRLRSHLDLLRPNVGARIRQQEERQKASHDRSRVVSRQFAIGDDVFTKGLPTERNWLPGTVVKILGPLTYEVSLLDG